MLHFKRSIFTLTPEAAKQPIRYGVSHELPTEQRKLLASTNYIYFTQFVSRQRIAIEINTARHSGQLDLIYFLSINCNTSARNHITIT